MTVRFEHSLDDADGLFRGLLGVYWLLALGLLVAAIWVRPLLVVAGLFAVVLVVWRRQIERAMPTKPWVLEIDEQRITVDRNGTVERVERGDATADELIRRLRTEVRADHKAGVDAALKEHGWPSGT